MRGAFAAVLMAGAVAILAPTQQGCAGSAGIESATAQDSLEALEVDRFFLKFRMKIQAGQADSLPRDLSRESLRWMEDIRHASRTEPAEYLRERPFHEILCILALRVERRLDPAFDDRPAGILDRILVGNAPVKRAFLKSELAPAEVRGLEGGIGLKEAPKVPVFLFSKEGGMWRFHLVRSMPLILQGAETLARQRKPTRLEQAIFLLDEFGRSRVLPEDLKR
jgi:hypothetical protein